MSASTRIIAAVLLVLAIVLGVLAFVVGRRPVAPPSTAVVASSPPAVTFPVVIANRPLEAGQSIPGDAIRVVQFPIQPTGAFSKVEDVVGHIPRVGIDPGIPLTQNSLSAGLPLDLKPGERGIAVPVDEVVGAGNAIQAGDFVDVFVTVRAPSPVPNNSGGERSVARLLLAKLRVLAYGADSLSPAASAQRQQGQPRSQARSAVLAVPVQDANDLILASQTGKLTLALRYPKDNALPDPDLFVAPERIFPTRPNLQADAKAQLDSPENQAFAGFDTGALIGSSDGAPPKGVPRRVIARGPARPVASDYVEIVRGTEIQRRSTANALGAGQ